MALWSEHSRNSGSPYARVLFAFTVTLLIAGTLLLILPIPFSGIPTPFLPSTALLNSPSLPFLTNLSHFPDVGSLPSVAFPDMPNFPPLSEKIYIRAQKRGMRVPNIVHYVYLTPQDGQPAKESFPFLYYLSVRSTIVELQPEVMMLHFNSLPHGPWWDEVAPYFTYNELLSPHTVFGNPIEAMAHKSDVIRILALREYGGIYMDMDLFAVKPFDDLMYAPATMALQRKAGYDYFCNAFIMAERRSRFMDLWWQSYEHFDHTIWDWNSGAKPFMIAKAFSDDIQALNGSAIFSPLWTDAAKPLVDNDIDFREDGHYAYHGWHRSAVDLFDSLNPRAIREVDTSFNRLVRPYLGEHDDDVWDTIHASP